MNAPGSDLFAVCCAQYPGGILDEAASTASRRRLYDRAMPDGVVQTLDVVALGNLVYADAAPTLAHAGRGEGLAVAYHSPASHWDPAIAPIAMADAHEFEESVDPVNALSRKTAVIRAGLPRFLARHRAGTPLLAEYVTRRLEAFDLWGEYTLSSGLPLFLCDTRTQRSHRDALCLHRAALMSETQLAALKEWLLRHKAQPGPKFVASPALVLPRSLAVATGDAYVALHSDSWEGYPSQFLDMLQFIACHSIHDVVFLSTGGQIGHFAQARLCYEGAEAVHIHAVNAPPLYAPFPFLNARPEQFAEADRFAWHVPKVGGGLNKVRCELTRLAFPDTGDGFVTVGLCRPDVVASRAHIGDFVVRFVSGATARMCAYTF